MNMSSEAFHFLYYLIILINSFFFIFSRGNFNKKTQSVTVSAYVLIISVILGLRGINVGNDTLSYKLLYDSTAQRDIASIFGHFFDGGDGLFYLLAKIFSTFGSFTLFLTFIALTSNILFYKFCVNISRTLSIQCLSPLVIFLLLMTSFVTFNMEINTVRSGMGMSLLLNAIFYLFTKDYKKSCIYGCIAALIHFSMVIFFLIAIMIILLKWNIKTYYLLYFISLGLSFIGIGILDLIPLGNLELRATKLYVDSNLFEYEIGFRPTFALYNTSFLLLLISQIRGIAKLPDIAVRFFKYYIVSTILFFLWFIMPFSDRIGAFSWVVIPILASYIFISGHNHSILRCQLFFLGYFIVCFLISSLNV